MNGQLSFSDMEYSLRKRQGKKEAFLNRMEEIIPWDSWIQIIAPIISRLIQRFPYNSVFYSQTETQLV